MHRQGRAVTKTLAGYNYCNETENSQDQHKCALVTWKWPIMYQHIQIHWQLNSMTREAIGGAGLNEANDNLSSFLHRVRSQAATFTDLSTARYVQYRAYGESAAHTLPALVKQCDAPKLIQVARCCLLRKEQIIWKSHSEF